MENQGEVMTGATFDYEFIGKVYKLKKATLRQVIEWQKKVAELSKDKTFVPDALIIVAALTILLQSVDSSITEDQILDNTPGDIDLSNTLIQLGFTSQQKMSLLRQRNVLANQPSGERSSV